MISICARLPTVAVSVLLLVVAASSASTGSVSAFEQWARSYTLVNPKPNNITNLERRFNESVAVVDALNKQMPTAKFSLSGPFSLLSEDEWKQRRNGYTHIDITQFVKDQASRKPMLKSTGTTEDIAVGAPDSNPAMAPLVTKTFTDDEINEANNKVVVDWQTGENRLGVHAITRVKNQGRCGSCWAFSTMGALEAQWRISGRQLTAFSEQYILDCVSPLSTYMNGCESGSMMALAMTLADYQVNDIKPVPVENTYQYEAFSRATESCVNSVPHVGIINTAYQLKNTTGQTMEDAMTAYLDLVGPLVVAVSTTLSNAWQHYSEGILECPTQYIDFKDLDHGVLIVGYGITSSGTPFWRVKNSWSPMWGENGYVRLRRGTNDCGIAMEPLGIGVPPEI